MPRYLFLRSSRAVGSSVRTRLKCRHGQMPSRKTYEPAAPVQLAGSLCSYHKGCHKLRDLELFAARPSLGACGGGGNWAHMGLHCPAALLVLGSNQMVGETLHYPKARVVDEIHRRGAAREFSLGRQPAGRYGGVEGSRGAAAERGTRCSVATPWLYGFLTCFPRAGARG